MPKASKADTFDVWGHPPKALTRGMSGRQIASLQQYAGHIAKTGYRLGYDNGLVEGMTTIIGVAERKLKSQRHRMLRSE